MDLLFNGCTDCVYQLFDREIFVLLTDVMIYNFIPITAQIIITTLGNLAPLHGMRKFTLQLFIALELLDNFERF